jgi:hypothetical protein
MWDRLKAFFGGSKRNVSLRPGFDQVCVIQGLDMTGVPPEQFEHDMHQKFGVRVQFLEVIRTLPDRDADGRPVEDTGGRSDIFFAAHEDDVKEWFNAERLLWRIRWIEDVLNNDDYRHQMLYPERVRQYAWPARSDAG